MKRQLLADTQWSFRQVIPKPGAADNAQDVPNMKPLSGHRAQPGPRDAV